MNKLEHLGNCLVCDSTDIVDSISTMTMMASKDQKWTFKQCRDCQMVFLSPRVKATDLDKYYTESYLPYRGERAWGKYSNLVAKSQAKIDDKRVATVLKYAPNAKSVLDLGCGKPTFLQKTAEVLNINSIGLDFSNKGWIEEKELYNRLSLFEGEIFDLPKAMRANVITMWHYLEHDYNPAYTLRHLSETQGIDTTMIIEVPNYESYTRRKYGAFWSGFHTPRHTGLYSPETLKLLLESNGWKVEDQYTYGTLDPYTLDWMSRMEQENIDWSVSMEPHFYGYVMGKILRPRYFFDKMLNLGFMTVIAKNKKSKFRN